MAIKNKKLTAGLSICLGALLFTSAAFADISSKNGYEQLKDAAKHTASSMSRDLKNFTFDGTIVLKDNGSVVLSSSFTDKIDNENSAEENTGTVEYRNGKKENSYWYRDKRTVINYSPSEDTYFQTEYSEDENFKPFMNPFEEQTVSDMEKIADAAVGSLKDYVMVEEKEDGSKELSGSLREGQIPALANAVSSFLFKQKILNRGFGGSDALLPAMESDIYIKDVNGKAVVNKDGIVESVLAALVLSGKDGDGGTHDISIEVLGKLIDINSTSLSKPDLSGKKVEKSVSKRAVGPVISSRNAGTYKNDIIIEKDGSLVKIGERVVVLAEVSEKGIAGRYYEEYKDGYAEYAANKKDFTFDVPMRDGNDAKIEYKDASGNTQKAILGFSQIPSHVYFYFENMPVKSDYSYDSFFTRVFD